MSVRKMVFIDKRAERELKKFSRIVYLKFQALFEILKEEGKLEDPFAKKLSGTGDLFEVRVKHEGQWRAVYAYIVKDRIIILSAFRKKTQKTPNVELEKAKKRFSEYKEEL